MNRSETLGALAAALAKAQGQMDAAVKSADNPYFKSRYADLASIVEAIKQPLATNGLAYTQATDIGEDGSVIVETALLHTSGEWISSRLAMKPVKPDPQGVGSAITYARRYGLQALVGIPTDDDDGNAASGKEQQPKPAAQPKAVPPPPAAPFEPPTLADFEEFASWFTAQLPLTSDAAIPAEARTRHAGEIRDAILSVEGMDTAKLQMLLKALTKRSTLSDQEPQQLRLLYQVVIVRKRTAELAAYAEALSRRGEV